MRRFPFLGQDAAPAPVSVTLRSPLAPHPFFFVSPPSAPFMAPTETVLVTEEAPANGLAVPILAAGALVLLGVLLSK